MASTAYGIVAGSGVTPLSACESSPYGGGLCSTLQALGATDQQLLGVAEGTIDPVALMDELTGGAPVPFNVASSASDEVLGTIGAATSTVQDTAASVVSGISGIGTWFSSNILWIVLGIVAILVILVFAYGAGSHLF
jgi:hypothetical protein